MISRRFLIRSAAALAGFGLVGSPLTIGVTPARAEPWEKPGDKVLGSPDAPVTVIEYFSLSCGHCATFHEETFPQLRSAYVDTGKVRFVMRDFPLNYAALYAAMLARCAQPEAYFDLITKLFETRARWNLSLDQKWRRRGNSAEERAEFQDYLDADFKPEIAEEFADLFEEDGFDEDAVLACLNDRAAEAKVIQSIMEAQVEYEVGSTPTFVVNGETHVGGRTFEGFSEIIDEILSQS